jgi:hypothetical protein
MTDLRYPIGRFSAPAEVSIADREAAIQTLSVAAPDLRAAVQGLSGEQLDTPYRPGGWTVRQVVHHVAESHMNTYIRFKLALTEENPTIRPYDENAWSSLPDSAKGDIEPSLHLLDYLHQRLVVVLRGMSEEQWSRTFLHPVNGIVRLDRTALLYAWHSKHHIAHIFSLRQRMGW